ncbi:hypothetical protein [uncultured Methanobrevibacter sp.]|uniref:hypothetical protein n=1 Tax=uncultured Methanobrevibacter sp. TaxID=253161 RepID=UPI00260062F2|nr:hypothetical protein [uncultured Methanobrevibacter sp.]
MQQQSKQHFKCTHLRYLSTVRTSELHHLFLLDVHPMQYVSPPSLLTALELILQMFSAISPPMSGIKWLCLQVPHTLNSSICFIKSYSLM